MSASSDARSPSELCTTWTFTTRTAGRSTGKRIVPSSRRPSASLPSSSTSSAWSSTERTRCTPLRGSNSQRERPRLDSSAMSLWPRTLVTGLSVPFRSNLPVPFTSTRPHADAIISEIKDRMYFI